MRPVTRHASWTVRCQPGTGADVFVQNGFLPPICRRLKNPTTCLCVYCRSISTEEVARHMVAGFGGVITQLTQEQAAYINAGR